MTCIVAAVRNGIGVMGSDSLGSNGQTKNEYLHGKIVSKEIPTLEGGKPILMGFTSSFRLGDLIRHSLTPPVFSGDAYEWMVSSFIPRLKADLKDAEYDVKGNGCNFLVIIDNRVFEVQDDFSVLEAANGYASVGSGEVVALGAMFTLKNHSALEIAKSGLEAADFHAVGVGGKHHYFQVTKDKVTAL